MIRRFSLQRHFGLTVAALILLCCAGMLYVAWHRIAGLDFWDPDDALRYVQVRDLLAGQSWFDVTQARINPPLGGPMHWSRIVDVPIAALMLVLHPLLGIAGGDRATVVLAPLLLTAGLLGTYGAAMRRFMGDSWGLVAVAFLAVTPSILFQFMPLRIDHHGWQVWMAAVALLGTFDAQGRRGGIVAGGALAVWFNISTEALPYAVLVGGVYGFAYLRTAEAWPRLSAYLVSVTVFAAAVLLGTRGWPVAGMFVCDALSPVYLAPILVATVLAVAAHRFLAGASLPLRFLALAIAGVGGAIAYYGVAGPCLAGPFSALDPVVYNDWYLHVLEGLPVWDQEAGIAGIVVVPAVVGLAGSVMALLRAKTVTERDRWLEMTLLAGGAFAIAIMVIRAMSVAHLFAIPGGVALFMTFLPAARAIRSTVPRIFATVFLFALTPCGLASIVAMFVPDNAPTAPTASSGSVGEGKGSPCATMALFKGLSQLPAGTVFAPLDLGPDILAFTHHSVVATGHHRNHAAMRDVIVGFREPEAVAKPLVLAHHSRYVAYCPHAPEVQRFAEERPDALINLLDKGRPPSWLRRVPMLPGETIRVFEVVN